MAEIGNKAPIGPSWPFRSIRLAGQSNERRKPADKTPQTDDENKPPQEDDDDQQHIDEYA